MNKIETVSFRTVFKEFIDLVSKKERMTLTEFINDCIRKELSQRTNFLADSKAIKETAEGMGIPEIVNLPSDKIEFYMPKEKWDIFHKKWAANHTRIEAELTAYFRDEGLPGKNGEIVEAPNILD